MIEHIKNIDDEDYYARKWIVKKFEEEKDDDLEVFELPF